MTPVDRVQRWLGDLVATLDTAAKIAERGRDVYDSDPAVALAFEALSNRVGEIAKRLVAADPDAFTDPIWLQAARNRDFVANRYDRIDREALWQTITQGFPDLRAAAVAAAASR